MTKMRKIDAAILTIGDEILYGQIVDTNSAWLGENLNLHGLRITAKLSVGDELSEITRALDHLQSIADVVLITGGLGPTADDLTREALASFFKVGLQENQEALEHITNFFLQRNRTMTDNNRKQALLPDNAKMILNEKGTAPGIWIEHQEKIFVAMPGVPHEMKYLITEKIVPRLTAAFQLSSIQHRMIHTVGLGESTLAEMIEPWEKQLPDPLKLAYLPHFGRVTLRLTGQSDSPDQLSSLIEEETEKLSGIIQKYIYGYDQQKLEEVIGILLKEKKRTLSAAESCSGGFFSHLVTSVAGSSEYFRGSVVAYDNEVKIQELDVPKETIEEFGAVSEETVKAMAEGVRMRLGTNIGVASSGIAGPGGGSDQKPVGTIWIAYSDSEKTVARKLNLTKDRWLNINLTGTFMLDLIRIYSQSN